jgi:hypothetical protein
LVLGVSLLVAAASAKGQPSNNLPADLAPDTLIQTITPVFGQLVLLPREARFQTMNERTNGPIYMQESVPRGESLTQWTEMLTLQGFRGLAANPQASPIAMVQSIAGGFRNACPQTFAARGLGVVQLGGAEGYAAVIGCGSNPAVGSSGFVSETMAIVVMRGRADLYAMQWAERGPSMAQAPRLDDPKWTQRIRHLMGARLCDPQPGETAPYPSCSGVSRSP